MERFAQKALDELNSVLNTPATLDQLEVPPEPEMGDFAFPCFRLAKELKKAPPKIAQEIAQQLQEKGSTWAKNVGPYVNFKVPDQEALQVLLQDILTGVYSDNAYGRWKDDSRGTWVIEYSSPNVAKTLNIYHLRPTALGAALDRIGRFRGYRVVSINHLGDWGKQYGMLAVAFEYFNVDPNKEVSMSELVDLYVKINKVAKENPDIEDGARKAFAKLESGDEEMTALWKRCVQISLKEFERVYYRLDVHFDYIWGESYYKDMLDPLIKKLKKKGTLIESDGAWVVPVEDENGNELPPCILKKSDGSTIYATRDVAAAVYRHEQFKFDRMTYIVGAEQKLHFQQVFSVLKKMECSWAEKCEHVPFGLYRFKDAKMSTRQGNFVTLESVLEEAKNRVAHLMNSREQTKKLDLSTEEFDAVTEAVAVGAVVFHDLSTDPSRDIEFDLDRVIDFEGETGPYLQYAHTRCLSILRKAQEKGLVGEEIAFNETAVKRLVEKEEIRLIKTLGQFPLHLERVLQFNKASQLANFLIDVTKVFGAFYRERHVLTEDEELSKARLMLVAATQIILKQGLMLLGIPLPKRM